LCAAKSMIRNQARAMKRVKANAANGFIIVLLKH
jgi:hypothetical protein